MAQELSAHGIFNGLRRMFLLVTPNETSFKTLNDVPDYVQMSTPVFVILVVIEFLVSQLRKDGRTQLNDTVTSIGAGILSRCTDLFHIYVELRIFSWIHDNYRILNLDWSSPIAWWLTFFGVDFGYYWFHRMAHEVNIIWAMHQPHHSSEFYNLTTALRQSVLQKVGSWMFYQPLAFLVSPTFFAVHSQFNLLFQFWLHTQYIESLGPLEYVFNSPKHHRIHHGRNRYSVDKNFGGILIIWDRMFGTFQEEKEELVYGPTTLIYTYNPIKMQILQFQTILCTFWKVDGFWNKWAVIWKGPGWLPGKPRRGYLTDLPDVKAPVIPYTVNVPRWCNAYVLVHFTLLVVGYSIFGASKPHMSVISIICAWSYIVLCLTSFGYIFESSSFAPFVELFRCLVLIITDAALTRWHLLPANNLISMKSIVLLIYGLSSVFWIYVIFRKLQFSICFKLKKNL